MEILILQSIFLFSVFISTLFCYLIPIACFSSKSTSYCLKIFLTYGNCLSCGVFIGVCFLGLIPFSYEKIEESLVLLKIETRFPLTESFVVLGYFLVLFVEQLGKKFHRSKRNKDSKRYLEEKDATEEDTESLIKDDVNHNCDEVSDLQGFNHSHISEFSELEATKFNFRFLILTLATSTHSYFEGLAVGLQTNNNKAMKIYIGMILHESLMAFALGASLMRLNKAGCQILKYVLLFCLAIPLGIISGMIIGQVPGSITTVANGILQSVAAGTFIHVTFMELIPQIFHDGKSGMLKILFIFNGFLLIGIMTLGLH